METMISSTTMDEQHHQPDSMKRIPTISFIFPSELVGILSLLEEI